MAIVNTIDSSSQFANHFRDCSREDNFSYAALEALYDYYEERSDDIGEDYVLDVVAICCEWSELDLEELHNAYNHLADPEDMPETVEEWEELLEDHATVLKLDNDTLLVQEF